MALSGTPGSTLDPLVWLAGGGEMGERTRGFDWSQTPVGPVPGWHQSLKIAVRIMLSSRYAMWIGWGPEFTFFYNDAYARMTLGPKHPWALGRPAREVWSEIWTDIGPRAEHVVRTGQATWDEGLLLFLERKGFPEESYHTFSYSPVPDDAGGIGGLLCVVTEDTERTIGERRLRTLRELAARTTEVATTADEAGRTAARTLAGNPQDLPFVLVYLLTSDGRAARLVGAAGLSDGAPAAPPTVDLTSSTGGASGWPMQTVLASGRAEVVRGVRERFPVPTSEGAWADPPRQGIVLPLAKPGQGRPVGFVVAGISPHLELDEGYRGFLDLLAGHVASAVANARAYEEERQRAESLAELDRAKTAFFSNVSHEFRTPLTLLIGPVGDLLASGSALPPAVAGQLRVVNRNALRLLRLVNTLLDFSRIEAGRVRATFRPTDLAAFTAELASNFRAACERAGLRLVVDCRPLDEPAFVDREMWEKVVLNLLSNAFKFTFDGEIVVTLRRAGPAAELTVRDTGTGIPAGEMPRLFERFHRVENARGRTHEGSGIGLALVQELVHLHGGRIAATSEVGTGTTFTVTVPLGASHLPPDQIGDARAAGPGGATATLYTDEAFRWLPGDEPPDGGTFDPAYSESPVAPDQHRTPDRPDDRPRVLVADDNADMRHYVARLLADQFRVTTVSDGEAAMVAAREGPPDLIVTDVMMPRLDGFGLLRAVRADPRTRNVPVVMLSARAGEESRVEGMEAGADDYIVKPFHARELLARIAGLLQLARLRREAGESLRASEERLRLALTAARMVVWEWTPADRKLHVSDNAADVFGLPAGTGLSGIDQGLALVHPEDLGNYQATFQRAIDDRGSYHTQYRLVRPNDGRVIWIEERGHTTFDQPRGGVRLFGVATDVTDRVRAEEEVRTARQRVEAERGRLAEVFRQAPAFLCVLRGPDHVFELANDRYYQVVGHRDLLGRPLREALPEVVDQGFIELLDGVYRTGEPFIGSGVRVLLARQAGYPAEERYVDFVYQALRDPDGSTTGIVTVGVDVTDRSRAERAVERLAADAERERRLFAAVLSNTPDFIYTFDLRGRFVFVNAALLALWGKRLDEVVGRNFFDLDYPPALAERLQRQIRQVIDTRRPVRDETPYTGLAGEREYDYILVPVVGAGGVVEAVAGSTRDITERKRAEQTSRFVAGVSAALADLTDSASTFHKVAVLSVPTFADWCAVDMVDEDGSPRRVAVMHADPDKVKEFAALLAKYPPRAGDPHGILKVIRTGEPELAEEITDAMLASVVHDEDHLRRLKALGLRSHILAPIRSHGRALGVLTFITAESGRLYTTADLAVAEDLAGRAAVAVENARLYQALQDADRRKDEFLATLAHELRNPLAPIRNAVQVFRLKGTDDPDLRRGRDVIDRQVDHLTRLIDDLLDLSRIARNKLELRRGRVTLADAVAGAVETSRPLIDQFGHRLSVEMPSDPVYLDADLVRLSQVFMNLLTNAAKYTPHGGHIRLTARRDGNEVAVAVRDNGLGIPAEKLPSLFEMFFQVDETLEKSQGGLGIGLSLVRRLVEMHGGTVAAHSDGPGTGSEFVVRLPVLDWRPDPPPALPAADAGSPLRTPGRRVLVVDDNRDAAETLAMLLTMTGHEVRTAHDGEAGVEAAGTFRPDIVLMDIGMPKLNGYEACRRIREQPWGRTIRLVALTGWGQDDDRRRTDAAGFDAHLIKPVDHAALTKLLGEGAGE